MLSYLLLRARFYESSRKYPTATSCVEVSDFQSKICAGANLVPEVGYISIMSCTGVFYFALITYIPSSPFMERIVGALLYHCEMEILNLWKESLEFECLCMFRIVHDFVMMIVHRSRYAFLSEIAVL